MVLGAPWDELTTLNAARFGHLEILKWAREQVKTPSANQHSLLSLNFFIHTFTNTHTYALPSQTHKHTQLSALTNTQLSYTHTRTHARTHTSTHKHTTQDINESTDLKLLLPGLPLVFRHVFGGAQSRSQGDLQLAHTEWMSRYRCR